MISIAVSTRKSCVMGWVGAGVRGKVPFDANFAPIFGGEGEP